MVEFRRVALGGHVVIKVDVPGLLHKTAAGAVELDLHGAGEVRAAMGRLHARFAGRMSGVLVEPMIAGGIETLAGVVQEPVFGRWWCSGSAASPPACSPTMRPASRRSPAPTPRT
jgi:acyl-CoA synthetase (NDP forming)